MSREIENGTHSPGYVREASMLFCFSLTRFFIACVGASLKPDPLRPPEGAWGPPLKGLNIDI
jgi:hypothetical protein